MSEQKSNPEERKDSGKTEGKDKQQSWGERVAEQIAGDNEMLKNVIKFLTNPMVMLGALLGLMWWLVKGKPEKEKLENLEKENKELKEELNGLTEDLRDLKEKHRNLRSRFFMKDDEENREEPLNGNRFGRKEKKENYYEKRYRQRNRYRPSYLD